MKTLPEVIRLASRFRANGMGVFIYDEGDELPVGFCVGNAEGEALDVLLQLRELETSGKITLEAWVRCQDGHEMWRGAAADALGPWTRCRSCPDPTDIETTVALIATITPSWKAELTP